MPWETCHLSVFKAVLPLIPVQVLCWIQFNDRRSHTPFLCQIRLTAMKTLKQK
jgi:hypothetical protein